MNLRPWAIPSIILRLNGLSYLLQVVKKIDDSYQKNNINKYRRMLLKDRTMTLFEFYLSCLAGLALIPDNRRYITPRSVMGLGTIALVLYPFHRINIEAFEADVYRRRYETLVKRVNRETTGKCPLPSNECEGYVQELKELATVRKYAPAATFYFRMMFNGWPQQIPDLENPPLEITQNLTFARKGLEMISENYRWWHRFLPSPYFPTVRELFPNRYVYSNHDATRAEAYRLLAAYCRSYNFADPSQLLKWSLEADKLGDYQAKAEIALAYHKLLRHKDAAKYAEMDPRLKYDDPGTYKLLMNHANTPDGVKV